MEDIGKWRNIRWFSVLAYLLVVFLLLLLLFILPSFELVLGILLMVVSVLGIVPLIIVINIPFIRMMRAERVLPTNTGSNRIMESGSSRFHDSVRMVLLIWIIVPMNLFLLIVALTTKEYLTLLFTIPIVILLTLSLLFFWKLDIGADDRTIWFYYGPIGRTLPFSDIRSIKPVEVHAIRDFMGWGWRSGSDGSIGYISNAKEGVRIETRTGRVYTITCHRPEELVRVVGRGLRR